jgi:hypothetical protein
VARYEGPIGVGDVVVTREGHPLISSLIRLGAWLTGRPPTVNHVIVVHHQDPLTGRWVGIEGRPSGTGWCDVQSRLDDRWTNANTGQPKTEAQRFLVARAAEALITTAYDWAAIGDAISAAARFRVYAAAEWPEDAVPGAVVCSSFADWAYERVGLPNPGGAARTRLTVPGDWDRFITDRRWKT